MEPCGSRLRVAVIIHCPVYLPSYYQWMELYILHLKPPPPEKYLVMDHGTFNPSEPVELESPISKT